MSAGRALIISPRLPEFDRESGLLRVMHVIEMLRSRDWEVTFGCLRTPTDAERYAHELEQRGVETYAPIKSIDAIREPDEFKLAIIVFWHVAERFLPELRKVAPSARVIVDSVDLHFLRQMRDRLRPDAGDAPGQLDVSHADAWAREINAYVAADAVLTVSAKEAALINDLSGRPELALHLPDTEELPGSPVRPRRRRGIIFLGNFQHAPNRDAATYLIEEIVPRLDPELLAEHEISIVGTAADQQLSGLVEGVTHVNVVGWVPSVLPYLNSARVSVVPLRYGAGTKRKLIQSLMVGTPTVTTTMGSEGLGVRNRREVLIADDPDAFAAAIERLLRTQVQWRRLARRGRKHILRLNGRATVEAGFDRVLANVLARPLRSVAAQPDGAQAVTQAAAYVQLILRVREVVESAVPAGGCVLVAARGDDRLLAFEGRSGWHFPRDADGKYAGYYPADSEAAVHHLEELRAQGATHLVLPRTSFWWLTHYQGLQRHLDAVYRSIRSDENVIIYDLAGVSQAPAQAETPDRQESAAESVASAAGADLIRSRQPSVLAAAARYRNGSRPGRALVLGVYLADKPNTAEHVAATLARSRDVEVRQRWAGLGVASPNGELRSVTVLTVREPTPKYALLNRLLAEEDLSSYDFVLTTDDDIVLPKGFLDLFLGIQAGVGFDLAQPARTLNSYVDHPIVLQQRGVVARRTLFVEIGPLVSFKRTVYDLVFPFDETNPMGWGFENVWAHRLRERGFSQGIVDAVPVDHSIREPVEHYRWSDANADRERYLACNRHLSLEECFRVLEVVGVDR
jgi:glycosyltransferase involved in cell wall biosynthesis